MTNYGNKVLLKRTFDGKLDVSVIRNVTEIHFNYPKIHEKDKESGRIAFESDIHGTGFTMLISEILEFETDCETEKATEFSN